MTAIEFAKQFNVWIAGDRSGYIKVCLQKPKQMEKEDFWLTAKEESTYLENYSEDYRDLKRRRCMFLISPDGTDTYEKRGETENMVCNDFSKGDEVVTNVTIIEVFTTPDVINDGEKHMITMRDDNNHDFMYTTKSASIPSKGERKLLKCKIVEGAASIEYGVPAFNVQSVKLLQPKK